MRVEDAGQKDTRPAGPDRAGSGTVLVSSLKNQGIRWELGERLEQLFERVCDQLRESGRQGHAAVDTGDEVLAYDALDGRANSLARHLLQRGARPGDRIALLFDQALPAYTAMLAVLKIGAAYVPLDPGFPSDRLAYIIGDADVSLVLTLTSLKDLLSEAAAPLLCLDDDRTQIENHDSSRLAHDEHRGDPDGLAYIIYTSGSTGRPKGVAIEHASICNFVRVAAETYGIRSQDRVYQGMTIAFDFSVEEIWVPWMVGATLVPKPRGASLLGAELAEYLVDKQITALCCVPTLLATLEDDLPNLRFLLVSGEACPRDLIVRWHSPRRRFLNVYGPTEATVTATMAVAHPDRPVTLGGPLPTYSVIILSPDENTALPSGELGEIGLAGIGLAKGYIHRDDLTAKAFIPDFLGIGNNPSGRIYRTGDLGRFNDDGDIEYHGRIDTQVKVRGYRIELAEIESVLLRVPGIAQAVVNTYEPEPGFVELVGYYTLRRDSEVLEEQTIRERLRGRLPGYMVPAYLEQLDKIPMLASDKADRKNLPAPRGNRTTGGDQDYVEPSPGTEQILAAALASVLRLEKVSSTAHFFNDLGANSLLMAQFSARLRKDDRVPVVAMRDVYLNPTVSGLAAFLDNAPVPDPTFARPHIQTAERPAPVSAARYLLCGTLQALLFVASAVASSFALVLAYKFASTGQGLADVLWRSFIVGGLGLGALCLLPIATKWLLIGRWTVQEIPVWSLRYLRFWVVKTLIRASPARMFIGTPIYPLYLRALGARIGKRTAILSHFVPVCTDLLTVGDDTIIRKDAAFPCYRAHQGMIQTGPVSIGRNALVGEATVMDIGTSLGDESQLGHASSLYAHQSVPAGQHWHGSPAQPTETDYRAVDPTNCGTLRRFTYSIFTAVNRVFWVSAALAVISLGIPAYLPTGNVGQGEPLFYANLLGISFILFFGAVLVSLVVIILIPRVLNMALKPDRAYPLYGWRYAIQRTIARMTNARFFMELTGDSSLIVHYLRLLGYRQPGLIQTGSNFGVALKHENPHAATIGSGTMVADGLSIMNADFSSSSFKISPTSIGSGSFLGNNIVYPSGSRIGDNCLLATKVMVPVDGPPREGVGLLGSPPFEIPRTVRRDRDFKESVTGPELRRRLHAKNRHNAVTIMFFTLSRWFYTFTTLLLASYAATALQTIYEPLALAGFMIGMVLFTVAYFVILERASLNFRRLGPLFCSIYDRSFWRHERFWKLSATAYLEMFNGTPFKNMIWRLLGVRIGKRVFDDGCAIPEKTIVTIGDDCTLNSLATIQCHSMEDGAFKVDGITIGSGCTIGVNAFIHYGVTLGDGAAVEADSFLMKGEEVPPAATFGGNPARELSSPLPPVLQALARNAVLPDLRRHRLQTTHGPHGRHVRRGDDFEVREIR